MGVGGDLLTAYLMIWYSGESLGLSVFCDIVGLFWPIMSHFLFTLFYFWGIFCIFAVKN